MRNIKINTIWLSLFYAMMAALMVLLSPTHTTSVIMVISGSIAILFVFSAALDIADFEMSALGQIVSEIENSDAEEIDVIINHHN